MSPPRAVIDRYAIHDAIASGGMATIHLGRRLGPAGFSRVFAVKRLLPSLASDPELRLSLADEARMMSRIRHSNVVDVVDVVVQDGDLLIVMEYVPGEPLSRLLQAARLAGTPTPPSIASSIVGGVLRGLHAAHQATDEQGEPLGIVHRDVSPENILVGADGTARVFDFGVARSASRLQLSRAGWKGKPCYMAPEQIRDEPVEAAADIWGASVVLWETLTGCRLFQGPSDYDVGSKVLGKPIDPPSRIVPGIAASLDDVVLRGLEREPNLRYATASEMAAALEAACPAATVDEVRAWVDALVGESLEKARSLVLEVERDTTPIPSLDSAAHEQVNANSQPDSPRAAAPGGSARRNAFMIVAAAILATGAIALWWSPKAARPSLPGTHPLVSNSPGSSEVPIPTPAPIPSASSAVPAASLAIVAPSSTPPRRTPAASATTTTQPSSVVPNCDPPYAIDPEGYRKLKPECL